MIIYNKSGIELCEAHKFTYSGTFMGETYITTTITSEQPIVFGIGAYCEYRGERFELNYIPSVEKVASTDSYGDAYKYEDVKFSFLANELSHCSFLDYVVDDNTIHYSGMPNFTFYGTVFQLAERIKANLDRIYTGDKSWTISVNPSYESAELNISATNISCMDALAFAKTSYGAHYIIRGRNITIGSDGVNVGHTFGYGIGNGLKNIKQVSNNDGSIITRLRSFGSTKNLPYRWYNKQINPSTGLPYIPDSMYVPNLMLPDFLSNGGDTYIDDNSAISNFGIREGVIYFDGTDDNYKEIYPTIEGITANQLIAAGISVTVGVGDNGNLDEIKSVVNPTDNGIGTSLPSTFTLVLKDLGFDLSEKVGDNYIYETTDGEMTVSMKSGMATGYDFSIISITKRVVSGVITFELVCNRYSDTDIGMSFPNTSYPIASGDKFVLVNIQMPDVYIIAASQRLLSASTDYLSKNNYQKVSYEPELDNLFMARNPSIGHSLKEGDLFDFSDSDLYVNDTIIVKTLEIRDGDSMIPQYSIILSNEYEDSTIGKINSEITKIKVNTPTANQQNNWDLSSAYAHYHGNKSLIDLINQMNIDVLGHLSVEGGKLKSDVDFYSLGEISAFGAGSGGSSGGGRIQTVYGYSSLGSSFNNDTLTDTFNAYTINQLHTRLSQVEVGAAINVTVSGSGNAVTGVTKNGDVLEFTKGVKFSLENHTHDYIPLSQKGTANGVAALDANGLIISAQLPSYVDDVIEVSTYANLPVSGESGKIYVTTDTNITYRWTGTTYVEIGKSLALGETSSTAYRGDLGAIAYAHSQIAGGTGVHVSSTERTNWNLAYTNNHTHTNKSVLDGITSTLIANWNTAYTNSHTHANKSLLDDFSQSDNDVLNHLSIVGGKLKVDIDFYSIGEVSAFGAGSGTGGSGLIQTVYGLSGLGGTYSDTTITDTFNAYTINSLHNRINSLEAGSALNFTTTGSGNVITSVTKSGTSVSVVKGLTAVLEGDTRLTNSRPNPYALTFSGYSTATYNGSAAVSVALPTKVSQLTNDSGYLTSIDADLVAIAALTGTSGLLRKTAANTWSLDTNAYLTAITKAQVEAVLTGNITTHTHSQYLTGNQTITVSGDATGSGTTSIALTLANSGVVAGTYNNSSTQVRPFTVDSKGRVTSIGTAVTITPAWGSVTGKPTTIGGYGITDAYTKTQIDSFLALKLDVATFNDLFEKVNIGTELSPVYAIKAKYNFYSVGEVSAFGAGAGSGSSGLIQTVYGYSGLGGAYNNTTLTDTFNAYTINKINTDLGARITSLEDGSALTFTTTGSGNAVTSVTKSGTSVTVTKGLTFSIDGHTHTFASLTSKPTTLSGYGITDALLASAYTASDVLNKIKTVDGDGSGLDADLLDGAHYQNILERNQSGYSKSGTATGWFRIATFTSDNAGSQDCILIINRTFNYASNETYKFSISAAYGGGINITQLSGYALTRLIDKIRVDYVNSGIAYIELHISTSTTNNAYRWTTIGGARSYTTWTVVNDTPNGTSYEFTTVNGCKSDRGFTGDLSGNSSTATKLQTARTIWGKSFDGTENVSGSLSNVTDITSSGNYYSTISGVARTVIDYYGGGKPIFGYGTAGAGIDTYLDGNNIYLRTSTGHTNNMMLTSSGNVLIGTTTNSGYKLDVNGTLRATGAVTLGSTLNVAGAVTGSRFYTGYDSGVANSMSCSEWFRSSGATGWINATYGGGIYMADTTYVKVYGNKAFWVNNNIVATGEITAFGASDIRLKSNIKQIDSALDFLSKVKTYEFDWNEKAIALNPLKTKRGAGVIAQEMSLLDNNFVHSIYGDYLGVDYERFIPYLIGGVNEVADEVTLLKKRVAELELEVKNIKNANNIL